MQKNRPDPVIQRIGVSIEGRVQGVGFRPAVYRNAAGNGLSGFVLNTDSGVYLEVQGDSASIKNFLDGLKYSPPRQSSIKNLSIVYSLPVKREKGFRIEKSLTGHTVSVELSPDIATCGRCLGELFTNSDRRYLFPFINCTDCGPRFSIAKNLPYDRANTTMDRFLLCPDCYSEYINPLDRRFHAQPDCCFACGPEFSLSADGRSLQGHEALHLASRMISQGAIAAVKGTGGYHLVCDAKNNSAVTRLRQRKNRGDKPFALMAKNIGTIERHCIPGKAERQALCSWRAPVVVMRKQQGSSLPGVVAPCSDSLGFFLPYAPVHHLLFTFGAPEILVATSANSGGEPIIFRDDAASMEKLSGIADCVLSNNRPIQAGCDDSVLKIAGSPKQPLLLRRARGYVPEPLKAPITFQGEVFAAGSREKNTFAFGRSEEILPGQHTGTIETLESLDFYREIFFHFCSLYGFRPQVIACDLHPDYLTSRFAAEIAEEKQLKIIGIQHHHAHVAACMLDNGLANRRVIGIAMDGTGYGEKGDIRGAEIMIADYRRFERFAFLDYVALPGGDKAVSEVWRTGLSYLCNAFGSKAFGLQVPLFNKVSPVRVSAVRAMIESGINCPPASSMGRLFDAAAAITGLRMEATYDAQAAIEMENAAERAEKRKGAYRFRLKRRGRHLVIDPVTVIQRLAADAASGVDTGTISYRLHSGIATIITEICKTIKKEKGISEAVLSGGVFQNGLLLKMLSRRLRREGFKVYTHKQLPPNDACISAGQAIIAGSTLDY